VYLGWVDFKSMATSSVTNFVVMRYESGTLADAVREIVEKQKTGELRIHFSQGGVQDGEWWEKGKNGTNSSDNRTQAKKVLDTTQVI